MRLKTKLPAKFLSHKRKLLAETPVLRVLTILALIVVSGSSHIKAADFSEVDRTILAEYRVIGRERVPIMIAAAPSLTAEVVRSIEALGGEIVSRQDDIGYLYVRMKLENVEALPKIVGIDAMQVACNPVRGSASLDSKGESKAKPKKKGQPPSPFLLLDNPFTADYVTQSSQLKAAHPTFDGRGVVIGFVEPADPSLPSMKGALDLYGVPVPKFSVFWWGNPNKPKAASTKDGMPIDAGSFWQKTEVVVPDTKGQIIFGGNNYKLPEGVRAKEWRVCSRALSTGTTSSSPAALILLWAVDQSRLWLLETGKSDFQTAPTIKIDPHAPFFTLRDDDVKREEDKQYRAWIFIIDESNRTVAFGRQNEHAEMVASVMAGNSFLGSQAGGVAPASQLAVLREGGGTSREEPSWNSIESMFAAVRNSDVDVVEASWAQGDTARGAATRVLDLLLDRLIRLKQKTVAIAAGNAGPAWERLEGFAAATEGFSIGGFVPQETWQAHSGFVPSADFTPAAYSIWGPTSDGALKPDFLALTQTLSEYSQSMGGNPWYEPPFGLYTVSGGTSAAGPHGAGNIALLVSGAKQRGIKYDPVRMRAAIATTAKFLPQVEARAQGYGLIQVADAWEALQRANSWEPSTITSSALVVSAYNEVGRSAQSTGRGLFEMRGWSPGMSGMRNITVTRTSGAPGKKIYRIRFKDNSGAFSSSLTEISLPLGEPVQIPLIIKVGESGSYSAVIDLIDPDANLVAHSVLATVFVSRSLDRESGYSLKAKSTLQRPGNSVVFVDVPAGLSALNLRVRRNETSKSMEDSKLESFWLYAQDPTGRVLPYNLYGSEIDTKRSREFSKGEKLETYLNPLPGVWQFVIQCDHRLIEPTEERLKSTDLTWDFAGLIIAKGDGDRQTAKFVNIGTSDIRAKTNALGLGSERNLNLNLKPSLKANLVEIDVPEGTKHLEVELTNDNAVFWAGLYIYKAPNGPDKSFGDTTKDGDATPLVYYDASHMPKKQFALDSPKGGKYVVAIDPLNVPANGLTVHYRDLIVHPAYGEMTCNENETVLNPGMEKSAHIDWKIASRPVGDRKLVAVSTLISPEFGYSQSSDDKAIPQEQLKIVPVPLAVQTIPLD